MTKRILVTGGAGFIGAALCHELAESGYEVSIFDVRKTDASRFQQISGDIRDPAAVRRAVGSCEIVFHLAGLVGTCYLGTRAGEAIDVNIHGAINVFEAAKASGAFVVNVGLNPEWLNAYMISKKAAMRFGLMYFQMFDTQIVTLELTHVYGPGQPTGPYRKAIPTFIVKSLANEHIHVYGSGDRMMDCVFVDDAARALRLAAERPDIAGKVVRVSSGMRISVLDLAYKIRELAGSASEIQLTPMRPGEPDEISAVEDLEPEPHSRTLLGWHPEIEFDKGLQQTIDWYGSPLAAIELAGRTRRNLEIERSLVEV